MDALLQSLDSLKFTDEQKGKVKSIYEKYQLKKQEKIKPFKEKYQAAVDAKDQEALKALTAEIFPVNEKINKEFNPERDKEIVAILTTEQHAVYKKIKEEEKRKQEEFDKIIEELDRQEKNK